MTRTSFQIGTNTKRNPTVLTWRLPKRQVTELPTVPARENRKKKVRAFGRRTAPPVG